MHNEVILKYFKYEHLPAHLQEHSKLFSDLANKIVESSEPSAERTAGLRKLLEAKDCYIRSLIK